MAQSEKEIIKRIKVGNQDAFKKLYLRYTDLLYAFILHQLDNSKEAAYDVWQETWIVAVEKIVEFRFGSSIFTWLCAIAKNKISDYYRHKEKQQRISDSVREYIDIDNEEIGLVDDNTREHVLTVLGDLNERYRYLLKARYLENKSIEEISLEIGKSYKATESMLSRSRETFRKKFMQMYNK